MPGTLAAPEDAIGSWVSQCCPQLQGQQKHNFVQVLRRAGLDPSVDFLGVVEGVVQMAPTRGAFYMRVVFRVESGSQISGNPHAQFRTAPRMRGSSASCARSRFARWGTPASTG